MRRLRRLIALLFLALLVATGVVFYYQRQRAKAEATPPPSPLPEGVAGIADRWQYTKTVDGKPIVEVSAREYRVIENPSRVELEDVELKIFGGDPTVYDLVKSKRADVDTKAKTMYSEGEVEIVMRLPNDGSPMPARPMTIRSSRVHFETETGIARTEERAQFQFAEGSGESLGAMYNPQTKEITLQKEAQITLVGARAEAVPTKVWASHALYLETHAKIELTGPTRMERKSLMLHAGDATIELEEGEIRRVEAKAVSGTDHFPNRDIAFGGDAAEMKYRPDGTLAEIHSRGHSRLDAVTASARSEVRSTNLLMLFREGTEEAELEKAFARENASVRSVPVGKAAETQMRRTLEAGEIELQMRPGGAEAERVLTHTAGTLTFLPASAQQRQRKLWAERMTMRYGKENQLEFFEASEAKTESMPSAKAVADARKAKLDPPPLLNTRSEQLEASFHPETGEMRWMKQMGAFQFDEGVRHGKASEAMLHQAEKYNLLDGAAQIWDATGSLQADRIRTEEPSGDLTAEGNVVSTRKPEKRKGSDGTALPGGEETLQATAKKMTTTNLNKRIRYDGNARLWQGANRLHGDTAIIDRDKQTIEGIGNVFSQIEESPKPNIEESKETKPAPAAPKTYTLINAARMIYKDNEKVAFYQGKVKMRRTTLSVDSDYLRMMLKETAEGETELDKAFADGNARIVMNEPGNLRRGAAEHAEYFPAEEKMVLYGGSPFFDDQKEGATRGKRLTYFSKDDRLIVESGDTAPAVSVIKRK